MDANLRFKLPEEAEEFETHFRGPRYRSVLVAVDTWLKAKRQFSPGERFEPQELLDFMCEELEFRGITLEEDGAVAL